MVLVAPLAGAWIEICQGQQRSGYQTSLLSQERGLKYYLSPRIHIPYAVAPLAGAWIEMI